MEMLTELTAIGFTEYEARVYVALLHEYPATGYQISKTSGVPRSMVYEALGRLHVRGAVLETRDERATLYRPLPPDVLLDQHAQEHRHLMDVLREGLRKLYESRDEDRVWSIGKRRSVLPYAAQMIQHAQHEAYLVLADPELNALHGDIRAACDRGVDVGVLLTGDAELGCGRAARHSPLESELQELTDTLMVVVDGAEALIARSSMEEMSATITRNPNLVLIARQFVWMELFAQRIHARLGPNLLARLDPEDRQIFGGLTG